MAEPILKWAGGKRQILREILSKMPKDLMKRRLHEPFFGGGAVTFKVEPREGTINDVNPKLMNFYVVLKEFVEDLIDDARSHLNERRYYYRARREFNLLSRSEWFSDFYRRNFKVESEEDRKNSVRLASLLLYLNKTAYNGLYRENSKGEFNVPFGRYKNPKIVDEEKLRNARRVLKNLKIFCRDFSYITSEARPGDVVYLDPPYHPISETSKFTNYSKGGFSYKDQVRLRNLCAELHNRGIYFVLSNSSAPEIVRLYEGMEGVEIFKIKAKRPINSKGDRRGPIDEILVTNVPEEMRALDLSFQLA